ncbi:acyl-CoA dehydrogenase [candidate division GN15 bacterium]|uniref:Acyl-CoA dehydrogenase n=1 Tax=candidate division GN15 bacterium TaxID=2072418 RepID=A0A855X2N8_9BACT|nr:MAG: acyl-CoA dehydrogenase [candidate division GN15 bacterium]
MLEKRHLEFREKIRAFALEKIEPVAATLDAEQRFLDEHIKPMTDMGLLSMLIPEQYGGKPTDTLSYTIAVEELSRVCGSTGITVAAHNSLGTFPVLKFGTEDQRKRYLPRAAQGGLMAFGLTEPDAGSDAGGTRTMARRDGSNWILNGSKCWITSATKAFATIASARTSEDPADKRITCFILEKEWPGYAVGKKENKLGLRGSDTAFLHFDDLKVPVENQLGEVGQGFKQMLITLDGGRISIGAMALGLGQGAFDCALKYAADRVQFGKPIADNQAIQHRLADMATELEAARLMCYEASMLKDSGKPFGHFSAMTKLYASEVATRAAVSAMTVLGSIGYYTGKYPVERIWRDVKLCEIGEGTSEIQRLVIARELLKSLKKV